MRVANRRSAIALGAALVLTVCVTYVRAGKPAVIPAWVDGDVVEVLVDTNVDIDNDVIIDHVSNFLYVVAGQDISHVLAIAPGEAGYNPHWYIVLVDPVDLDVVDDPLTSEAEILAAAAANEVTLNYDSGIFVLCPVISP